MRAAPGQKRVGHAAKGLADEFAAVAFGLRLGQIERLGPTPGHLRARSAADFAERIGAIIILEVPKQKLLRIGRNDDLPLAVNERLPLGQFRMLRLLRLCTSSSRPSVPLPSATARPVITPRSNWSGSVVGNSFQPAARFAVGVFL